MAPWVTTRWQAQASWWLCLAVVQATGSTEWCVEKIYTIEPISFAFLIQAYVYKTLNSNGLKHALARAILLHHAEELIYKGITVMKPNSLSSLKKVALSISLTLAAASAQALVVFDNFKGTNATNYVEETRNANQTFGTVLNSLSTTTINLFGVRWKPNNAMTVKFNIWDSALGGQIGSLNWTPIGNNLLFSQTKSFGADATLDYMYSDIFSFTFQANHRYDIGIIFDTGSALGSWDVQNGCGQVNTIQGGFESINNNANIVNFGSPQSNAGYACVDPHIQLVSDARQNIPEPATAMLIGLGLLGMGIGRRSLRK